MGIDLRPTTRAVGGGGGSDYSQLVRAARDAGLLERSVAAYLPRIAALTAATAVGAVVAYRLGPSWWQLAVAAWFAVLFGQIGFLAHDAGHQQVFRSRRRNARFGAVLSNLGIGLGFRWWVEKHHRHHQRPNDVAVDPDVQRGVLVWDREQAARQRGPLRFLAAHQAGWFFPLLLLEAVNLHLSSVRAAVAAPWERRGELLMLAVHFSCYLGAVFWLLPVWQAVAFVAVHQALLGLYLGCSFAPNHKGMLMPGADDHLDFFRRQVLTSRNVRGGRLMCAGLGALNYQIEHHLFPSMPSHNLRRVQPAVRAFCRAHGVPYAETGLIESYRQGLRHLADLGDLADASDLDSAPPVAA